MIHTAQLPIPLALVVFIFGACVGSFLNVVIYRLPEKKSIVFPGSHCPVCNHTIPFYLNIPVLSYLLIKGRCRFCKTPISARYPVIECLTGGLAVLLLHRFGIGLPLLFWFVFGCALIVVTFIDIDHQIIPDIISIPGIFIFASSGFFIPEMTLASSLYGVLTGGGVLYAVALGYYLLRGQQGMGGGDIKLLAMIGAATGVKGVLFTMFAGSLAGTCGGVATMIFGKNRGTKVKIPFGPYLSAGAMVYVLWGNELIYWYFSILSR
ncbi:MAG: prepilin peptidase [Desulfobacterales bacterium]|nr:prepilin peptidase [Desulfobacterales bacterium]